MISEVYKAFKEANMSDAAVRKAAEAVAATEDRFASLERTIERLDGRMTLMPWMLALLIGGVASLIVKGLCMTRATKPPHKLLITLPSWLIPGVVTHACV